MQNAQCASDIETIKSEYKYYYHPLVNSILKDHLKTQEEMECVCSFLFTVYAKQIIDIQFINECNEEDLFITNITPSFIMFQDSLMLGNHASLIFQLLEDAGVLFICEDEGMSYIKFTDNKFLVGRPFRDVSTKIAHDKWKQYVECESSWIDGQLSLPTLIDGIGKRDITKNEFDIVWRDYYEDRIESGSSELSHETWEQMGKDAGQVIQLCNVLPFLFT